MTAKRRIEEIDVLMGICMIVVALGHSFPTLTSSDVGTPFYYLYRAIHASVLPFFFFLSGVVASRILDCTTAKDKVENIKNVLSDLWCRTSVGVYCLFR
jgi:fucose 4-O-acetylase-like acetyltransferase